MTSNYSDGNQRAYSDQPTRQFTPPPVSSTPDPGYYPLTGRQENTYGREPEREQERREPASTPPRESPIDNQSYFAGVAATALVAAIVGWLGSLIITALYKNKEFGAVWGVEPQKVWETALYGGVGALVAGCLFWVLINIAPAAETFFYWVTGLLVFAAVILPFLNSTAWQSALITAAINGIMGIVVISILGTVARKTVKDQSKLN